MSRQKKKKLIFDWPIIDGSVSTAFAKCGQANCRCRKDPKAMHGPYYRWIGNVNGKKTTRTINAKLAKEIKTWITNCENLQRQIEKLIESSIDSEVWKRVAKK